MWCLWGLERAVVYATAVMAWGSLLLPFQGEMVALQGSICRSNVQLRASVLLWIQWDFLQKPPWLRSPSCRKDSKLGPELSLFVSSAVLTTTLQKRRAELCLAMWNAEHGEDSVHPVLWFSAHLHGTDSQEQAEWRMLKEVGFCNFNYLMIIFNCLLSNIARCWEAFALFGV